MAVIKDFQVDHLHVQIFDTRAAMGRQAGRDAADCVRTLLKTKPTVNVMFAAAPSQNETLAAFMNEPNIDWSRINAFHMDEYVGLDPQHPAGFRNFLKRTIFDHRPFRTVNLINGNADDPQAEAVRYGKLLADNPLDVCLLGVGENGHIAFNDPSVASFNDTVNVKIVSLEKVCRQQQVNDGCFDTLEQVPTHAFTVTIPPMVRAGSMFCSVPAATKANAIDRMVHGEISEACPCSILRRHPSATLYVDADAGSKLL